MKNLVVLFFAFFSLVLVSCSDVSDNSFLTNPVMEKSISSVPDITPAPVYPYPYLFSFSSVEGLKYLNLEGENAIEFYMTETAQKYAHLYVTVTYFNDVSPKMFFIDNIEDNSFKLLGVNLDQVHNISVYGLPVNNFSTESVSPYMNNSIMNEVSVNGWKVKDGTIQVECGGIWPSSLKSLFAEIRTKDRSYFVFLQKPWSTSFEIPAYGKYGVEEIRLFGYQTLMEATAKAN
ncbi:MAG: hypothetical protein IPJ23_18615 [Ignavibacteriales bacterium]|nr:hypothetical protein [Ignavibacteriales bacterium]